MIPATAVLIAGGKSRRMGTDKAFLPGRTRSLWEDITSSLELIFPEVLISGNDPRYSAAGYRVFADEEPGLGPLGGLCRVLREASYPYIFVTACDLPFFNNAAPLALWEARQGALAVIPKTAECYHPLHAFYHRDLLPVFTENLSQRKLKIITIIQELDDSLVKYVEFDGDLGRSIATNVNTPAEWQTALAHFSKSP